MNQQYSSKIIIEMEIKNNTNTPSPTSSPIHTKYNFYSVLKPQKHNYIKIKQLHNLKQKDLSRSVILQSLSVNRQISPKHAQSPKQLHALNKRLDKQLPKVNKMNMTNCSFRVMRARVKENYKFIKLIDQQQLFS